MIIDCFEFEFVHGEVKEGKEKRTIRQNASEDRLKLLKAAYPVRSNTFQFVIIRTNF